MEQNKEDSKWLKEWASKNNLPSPLEDLCFDFSERVSIMIHDGGLSDSEARNEAAIMYYKHDIRRI